MDFSILTYNTLFGDAVPGLKHIVASQHPDIICLQEVDTNEATFAKIEELGYRLADYSNVFIKFGNIYGVATFYNKERFEFIRSKVIFLPKGLMEILVYLVRVFKSGKKARTVLKTDFMCTKLKKKVSVYNIHLSAHGTNGIRIKQLQKTLEDVGSFSHEATILTGDFNYPYGRKKLEALMNQYSFKEATNTILFTSEGATPHYTRIEKFFAGFIFRAFKHRLKNDYVFYSNCESVMAKRVNVRYSDHFPVFAVFKLI